MDTLAQALAGIFVTLAPPIAAWIRGRSRPTPAWVSNLALGAAIIAFVLAIGLCVYGLTAPQPSMGGAAVVDFRVGVGAFGLLAVSAGVTGLVAARHDFQRNRGRESREESGRALVNSVVSLLGGALVMIGMAVIA